MYLLILGVVLWWATHVFKRLAPAQRAAMGTKGKGPIALMILLSVVLMVVGFRGADFVPVYDPPSWGRPVNNLLMIVSVILFGLGSSKSRARKMMRHPMLTGFLIWCVAHLLVNGDRDSIILFAGLGLWSIVQVQLINRAEPKWKRYEGGSVVGDIRLVVISAVVFSVIAAIHIWLGYNPFKA